MSSDAPQTPPTPITDTASRAPAGVGDDPNQRRLALRVVPMPRDTNQYRTVFGGVILSYIDQAGLVEARRHGDFSWVTASVERVDFRSAVHVGDIVSLYTRTTKLGRTSVCISVDVESERSVSEAPVRVTSATITMVALDDSGRPTPFRETDGG